MKLTFEQTQGTRTFYFPLERSSNVPPEFTVVITPDDLDAPDSWRAGLAVCSYGDQFSKARGRLLAFGRLHSQQGLTGSAAGLRGEIISRLVQLEERHGYGIVDDDILEDLASIFNVNDLKEYFDSKRENREKHHEAPAALGA